VHARCHWRRCKRQHPQLIGTPFGGTHLEAAALYEQIEKHPRCEGRARPVIQTQLPTEFGISWCTCSDTPDAGDSCVAGASTLPLHPSTHVFLVHRVPCHSFVCYARPMTFELHSFFSHGRIILPLHSAEDAKSVMKISSNKNG
jgi:hypothetical protein